MNYQDRIKEIKARLEAATPGPWHYMELIAASPNDIEYLLKANALMQRAIEEFQLPPFADSNLTSLISWINSRAKAVLKQLDALGGENES